MLQTQVQLDLKEEMVELEQQQVLQEVQ